MGSFQKYVLETKAPRESQFVALWSNSHNMISLSGRYLGKFCYILVNISVFDIKSNLIFLFIHILDHSIFDCRAKIF